MGYFMPAIKLWIFLELKLMSKTNTEIQLSKIRKLALTGMVIVVLSIFNVILCLWALYFNISKITTITLIAQFVLFIGAYWIQRKVKKLKGG